MPAELLHPVILATASRLREHRPARLPFGGWRRQQKDLQPAARAGRAGAQP